MAVDSISTGLAERADSPRLAPARDLVAARYLAVRRLTEQLCQPLQREDYGLQAMPSTSPAKWHLAHVSWFFETFLLRPFSPGYQVFNSRFEYLFNSYYNGVGAQYPRGQRGLLSRPTVDEVYRYRRHVDEAMLSLLESSTAKINPEIGQRTLLGCHHEQQHQELLFTDLKYCWFQNPLYPAYCDQPLAAAAPVAPMSWTTVSGGLYQVGYSDDDNFCFDNELPRHRHYLPDFSLADRLVSNGEYLQFMRDSGYQSAHYWLADGWSELQERALGGQVLAPLYWLEVAGQWMEYTLHGLAPLDLHRPVSHLSAYEADAYARWAGCRLPTEFEWEVSIRELAADGEHNAFHAGQFLSTSMVHPLFASSAAPLDNLLGRLWQWTSSAYSPYPGFRTAAGAIGEYNGKFMSSQLVLRGGSCVTSSDHYRHSYRNFFYPGERWQFSGIRLARDA